MSFCSAVKSFACPRADGHRIETELFHQEQNASQDTAVLSESSLHIITMDVMETGVPRNIKGQHVVPQLRKRINASFLGSASSLEMTRH